MPIMGQLTTKIQARYLIAFGWLALSIAMFYSTKRIDLQISFNAAIWLRVAQVIGLGFLFVPITLVATSEFRRRKTMRWPESSISCATWEAASELR